MYFDASLLKLLFHLHSIHDRDDCVFVSFGIKSRESEQHVVLGAANFEAGHEVDDFDSAGWLSEAHISSVAH